MRPAELYRYDVNGYILLRGAIGADDLARLNRRVDAWEASACPVWRPLLAEQNR